ncbi:hypothetical protein [Cellulosimicrobium arenosum]|uniref:Uncharacterized protein n=1 Tax=Cellulosimicrobium arenosum TaxID=2708133 RepID=A0A927G7M8_9MICO|nr:hypothetical protein [Cellulosimicrobium arenosum]MBD8078388.1 hypothetical protein [Cellulosimicrobium arenosum]
MSRNRSTTGSPARRTTAGLVAATLLAAPALMAATASSAAADEPTDGGVTTSYLADDSDAQQRWLSVPDSRIVLNPFDSGGSGNELEQTAGPSLPLDVGYYADDKAIHRTDLLSTYATSGERPDGSAFRAALSEPFDGTEGWSTSSVTTTSADGLTTLRLDDGKQWGSISRDVTVQDVTDTRYLTVDVAALSPGSTWNIKVNTGSGDDLPELQADSSATGSVTFDLAEAYDWTPGPKTFRVKLYAVNKTGQPGGMATFRSMSLDNGADLPWADETTGVVDDFADLTGWARSAHAGGSASITTDGTQGTVHMGDSDYGAVEREVTVDLDATPLLSVRTAATTGEWALKLSTGSGDDLTVQPDTSTTGVMTYDIPGTTGWTGERTFRVKLFHIGKNGASTFDDLAFHSGDVWLRPADESGNRWQPQALESSGQYADGSIETVDAFHDVDSFSRTVKASTDGAAVAGAYEGSASWDAAASLLTVEGEHDTYSVALPPGADVRFGGSVAELGTSGGSAEPLAGNGAWTASLPGGEATSVVGVGFAVNDPSVTDDAAAASRDRARSAAADPAADRETWGAFWDEYLAKVPVVQDFSVQRVADGGVTADEMRRFWYRAWVSLEMNVLPATPETGNAYAQLGTGKPSLWMNGTPGTRNVASWDSLLGMQQLVYTDPESAWASFEGMMALVEDGPDATEPSDEEYGTRGELGGESLPSRKAQTAWILYSVTGDRDRLEGVYDKLALHLNWERYNMRWVLGANNHFDERDSEFVTSLAYDLEFAIKIADELGNDEDAEHYRAVRSEISEKYSEWFFPAAADQDGKVWDTVQKVYLDASRDDVPFGDDTEGQPFRNEDGQWVRPGWSFYTSTAFVMDELDDASKVKVMDRFLDDYDEDAQLAGLGDFAVKAPDLQLIAYGLLGMDPIAGSDEAALRDRASVLVNAINRDMVRSGWFAEVYYAQGEPGDSVGARGVRPSLFGISNYIDFVLMANGVRTDEGDPTFVRLAGATGGVSGLTYGGQHLDVDLDGGQVRFSGPAADGVCDAIDVAEGETVTWADDCGATAPTVELEGQAQVRCLAGTAYVAVRAQNVGEEPVDVRLETPFGSRTLTGVAPGANAYQSFAARAASADAGTATVVGTGPDGTERSWDVAFDATTCG